MSIELQITTFDFWIEVEYEKDALFDTFEFRVYEDGGDPERAEILKSEGFGSDPYTIFMPRQRKGTGIGEDWYADVRVRNVDGQVSDWASSAKETGTGDDISVLEQEGIYVAADFITRDGATPLIDDWDAGPFEIRAETFESDVITGTAPLTVASTTLVSNLNADLLDGQEGTHFLDSANFTGTDWTDLTDAGATTLHKHDHGGLDGLGDDDHTQYLLANATRGVSANWDIGDYQLRAKQFYSDTDGATGGILLGSDTQFYQSASNTIYTPDALGVGGVASFGHSLSITDATDTKLYLRSPGGSGNTQIILEDNDGTDRWSFVQYDEGGLLRLYNFTLSGAHVDFNLDGTTDFEGGNVSLGTHSLLFGTFGSEDVNLYRSAANVLKTDDSFIVGGDVTVGDDLFLNTDAANIYIGADDDLQITHSGTGGTINSLTGGLSLKSVASLHLQDATAQNIYVFQDLTSGNPVIDFFGWDSGSGSQKYGELGVNSSGEAFFQYQNKANLRLRSYTILETDAGSSMYFDAGNLFTWRDVDDGKATRMSLDSATGLLTVTGKHIDSTAETLQHWALDEDTNSYLRVGNITGINAMFKPMIYGRQSGVGEALFFVGATTTDTGVLGAIAFDGRLVAAPLATRPIMTIANYGTKKWTLSASGAVWMTNNLYMPGLDIGSTASEIGNIYQGDSKVIYWGADQDAYAFHDGSNFYLKNYTGETRFWMGAETALTMVKDGAVTLYWNNTPKFATATGGVSVTGSITTPATTDLTLAPTGDLILDPAGGETFVDGTLVSDETFASGVFGSGWRVSKVSDEWSAEFDRLTVRGTLEAFVFKKHIVQASNALLLVTDSCKLDDDVTAIQTALTVVENTLAANDVVLIQDEIGGNIYREIVTVTSVAGDTVNVTRAVVGTARAWPGGTVLTRIGNTATGARQGSILLDAGTANAPFIDILGVEDTSDFSATYTESVTNAIGKVKVRLGQLSGITDAAVGLSGSDEFGLYASNAYLKGRLRATLIETAASGQRVEIDGTENELTIYDGDDNAWIGLGKVLPGDDFGLELGYLGMSASTVVAYVHGRMVVSDLFAYTTVINNDAVGTLQADFYSNQADDILFDAAHFSVTDGTDTHFYFDTGSGEFQVSGYVTFMDGATRLGFLTDNEVDIGESDHRARWIYAYDGSFADDLFVGDDIVMGAAIAEIRMDTADGSDNKGLSIAGGGTAGSTRGADFYLYGNEHASHPGRIFLRTGAIVGTYMEFEVNGTKFWMDESDFYSDSVHNLGQSGNYFGTAYLTTVDLGTDTIEDGDPTDWNAAYGWGDHAEAGYAPAASPTFTGTVTIPSTADDATYTGIVTNDGGVLKYRTKAQMLSDIAALPLAGGTMDGDIDLDGNSLAAALNVTMTGYLDVGSFAYFAEYLYHTEDSNTYIRFLTDTVEISAGGHVLTLDDDGLSWNWAVGITVGSSDPMTVSMSGAWDDQVINPIRMRGTVSGGADIGFGASLDFDLENAADTGYVEDVARIAAVWTDVTDSAEHARLELWGMADGDSELFAIFEDGDVAFFAGTAFEGCFTHENTADRIYTFPDKAGTVAMTSDISEATADVWIPLGPWQDAKATGTGTAATSPTYTTSWSKHLNLSPDDTGEILVAEVLYVHDDSHSTIRMRYAAWITGDTFKATYRVRFKVDGVEKFYDAIAEETETNLYYDWPISGMTAGVGYALQMTIRGTTDALWDGDDVYFRHNPKKTMFYANAA